MSDDVMHADLYAALESMRRRADRATADFGAADGRFFAEYVPRLLFAVQAVIAYHTVPKKHRRNGRLVCAADSELMPCLHIKAIRLALLGHEGEPDGLAGPGPQTADFSSPSTPPAAPFGSESEPQS